MRPAARKALKARLLQLDGSINRSKDVLIDQRAQTAQVEIELESLEHERDELTAELREAE
jgi:septal ring factor EnvC (AmiA/AmiB activator)